MEKNRQNGRKRSRNLELWQRNVAKKARNKGKEYVSRGTKKVVAAKEFKAVTSCCKKECHTKISEEQMRKLYTRFWDSGDWSHQSTLLSCMLREKSNGSGNLTPWEYYFPRQYRYNEEVVVCRDFLCKTLDIKRGKFITIQKKMKNDESLSDKRGGKTHFQKLTDHTKKLIHEHCESLAHTKSHYRREQTSLNYFKDSSLNLSKLYKLFVQYYESMDPKKKCPVKESTYCKYFNHFVNFTFDMPRTDVCNDCFTYEQMNARETDEAREHYRKVNNYREMRDKMLSMPGNILRCEFDYGQNLPLPKLPVSTQFYLRLMWLFIFNVHVYHSDRSYMFTYMEGLANKGSNSVCNMILNVIKQEFDLHCYDRIFLFSDACGGQNRNHMILMFLSLLSEWLQIEIIHLYPVRGHSYCQCDRNFGMYGYEKKKTETIETEEDYIKIIGSARNPPFTVLKWGDFNILDYETRIKNDCKIPKGLLISKAAKIAYFPNGEINVFNNCDEEFKSFFIDKSIAAKDIFEEKSKLPANPSGITNEKRKDVMSLLKFVTPKAKEHYKQLFETIRIQETKKEGKIPKNYPKNDAKKLSSEKTRYNRDGRKKL